MIKKILIFLIITVLLFNLTGCYDARGIDELSYVIAIGIDEGKNNKIYLTLQFAAPSSGSSSGSQGGTETSSSVTTVECSSIDSGLAIINSYISKQINLSHCKVIVISETFASKGISEYIPTLANHVEIRPDCNVIISKCDARNFIANSKPVLETLSARYFETSFKSSEYTGYTSPVVLYSFFSSILDTCSEAYAILGGINVAPNHKTSSTDNNYMNQDSSYTSGETPISNESILETTGLAVFKGDRLVGELNGIETICHLMLTNHLKNCTISIPSPIELNNTIDLYLSRKNSTKNDVSLVNNTPYITSSVSLTGFGLSSNIDYNSTENLKLIEQYACSYIKEQITSYLYKTSKSYKADIVGFGKNALTNYLTWDEWIASNWLDNYENSFFDVTVNVDITSGYLFNKT